MKIGAAARSEFRPKLVGRRSWGRWRCRSRRHWCRCGWRGWDCCGEAFLQSVSGFFGGFSSSIGSLFGSIHGIVSGLFHSIGGRGDSITRFCSRFFCHVARFCSSFLGCIHDTCTGCFGGITGGGHGFSSLGSSFVDFSLCFFLLRAAGHKAHGSKTNHCQMFDFHTASECQQMPANTSSFAIGLFNIVNRNLISTSDSVGCNRCH